MTGFYFSKSMWCWESPYSKVQVVLDLWGLDIMFRKLNFWDFRPGNTAVHDFESVRYWRCWGFGPLCIAVEWGGGSRYEEKGHGL